MAQGYNPLQSFNDYLPWQIFACGIMNLFLFEHKFILIQKDAFVVPESNHYHAKKLIYPDPSDQMSIFMKYKMKENNDLQVFLMNKRKNTYNRIISIWYRNISPVYRVKIVFTQLINLLIIKQKQAIFRFSLMVASFNIRL